MPGNKYLKHSNGLAVEEASVQTSAGAGDAGKIPALDASGRFDNSMMPAGIGAETKIIPAFENLAAGDFVNIFVDSGTLKVRKADASAASKRAHGFVLAAVTAPAGATIYYGNLNTQKSGLTLGAEQYLSGSTPGATAETPPTTASYIVQRLGVATATTEMLVEIQPPIQLA